MAKTKKEKQFELNQLMEMKAPQQKWLTKEIYKNYLDNKSELKRKYPSRSVMGQLWPLRAHFGDAGATWGEFEVDESPKILVEKWENGTLISNPETGQDPKTYTTKNKNKAEIFAAIHWGYEDKLKEDGTLHTSSMWTNRGVFNAVMIDNKSVLEPVDAEHRVWGLVGFPLGLIKLKSDDGSPIFFENYKLPKKMIQHFGEKIRAIQINDMDLYEIVSNCNKVIEEQEGDTKDLVTEADVLNRFYRNNFKFTILPFCEKTQCERFFKHCNMSDVKKPHQILHAHSSDVNWILKTISSPKVTEFEGNECVMHPFFKLFPKSSQVALEPFMLSHLISQYLIKGDLIKSSDVKISEAHTKGYDGFDKEQLIETLDYLYNLYSKLDNFPKQSPQLIQMLLKTRDYLDEEGFTLIDSKLFIEEFHNFLDNNIYVDKVDKICTKFGYDMRCATPGNTNNVGTKRGFKKIKIDFLGNKCTDEDALIKIGIVKKSDDLPRFFTRPIIKKSSDKHKGIDIDNTPIEGMDVGGHIISDMELIRMTTEERDEAFKQEGFNKKFDFNSNCRAMSRKHNQRMGVLRLSEYLKIMNKSDEEVREIEKKKKEKLRAKPILV